ncbi:DUF2569 domain-containing protein [Kosakonia sp. BK9b]
MGVCIQCDKEALKDSDYCAQCEEREFKKIRGWLYVAAFGLIMSILSTVLSINSSLRLLMEYYAQIDGTRKAILFFELFAWLILFGFSLFTSSLFFRKKRLLPRCYIALLVMWVAFMVIDLLLAHQYLAMPFAYETVQPVIRNILSACIWIPYFLVSVRVKRTFVR